jgi:hypothetical protein
VAILPSQINKITNEKQKTSKRDEHRWLIWEAIYNPPGGIIAGDQVVMDSRPNQTYR